MQLQPLDRMFVALGDPNRRGMVEHLSAGPATVKQLASWRGMQLPSALKHLKVLEEGGIVVSEKIGRTRTYSVQLGALRTIADWVRSRETAWNAAFDRLAEAMQDISEEDPQG